MGPPRPDEVRGAQVSHQFRSVRIPAKIRQLAAEIARERDVTVADVISACVTAVVSAGNTADGLKLSPYALMREYIETVTMLNNAISSGIAVAHELRRRGLDINSFLHGKPIPKSAPHLASERDLGLERR